MIGDTAIGWVARLRAGLILFAAVAVTLPLMVLQALLLRLRHPAARRLPAAYHCAMRRLMGLKVTVRGAPAGERPLLLVSNHVSWLDIPVLSSVLPLSFIAKREVRAWPFVGWLARLQRTVFVDRDRRNRTGAATSEIAGRLHDDDAMVLFAEGTSGDGNRILPFRSALLGAAEAMIEDRAHRPVTVQPVAIAYGRVNGLPMGRQHRHVAAWYGDMELPGHLWALLCAGPVDVVVSFGVPVDLTAAGGRKGAADAAQAAVKRMFTAALTGQARAREDGQAGAQK